MSRLIVLLLFLFLVPALASAEPVHVITIQGAVSPASADYVVRGLEQAAKSAAPLIVLELDTPGGLDTSMRAIIKAILASPVPVAGFVFPEGGRAASAGTYILYACHIAAMAPATNLGAATPIAIGIGGPGGDAPPKTPSQDNAKDDTVKPAADAMTRKQVHDAAAYIRSLAELRGRNIEWAERAVREAVSLSATQALEMKVIDVIAADVGDLLRQIDGRTLKTVSGDVTLRTQGAAMTRIVPDWRSRLLAIIGDPSIAYILMLVGIYGLFFEFSNPGFGLPGVAGAICLLLALFAFQLLPVNYAGLALVVLGIALMVAEAFIPSFGVLGLGGIAAFIIGSVMLIDTDLPGYGLPWALIVPFALVSALFMFFIGGMALRARRRPVTTGKEELLGATGELVEDCATEGWARIHSETWKVRSRTPLARGTPVRVVAMDGLVLIVEPTTTQRGD